MKEHLYKVNSLHNFHYGLNRILKSKGHLYDIPDKHTTSVLKSQQVFSDAIKELKAEGKADVDSYPEIEEEGTNISLFTLTKQLIDLGQSDILLDTSNPMAFQHLSVQEN